MVNQQEAEKLATDAIQNYLNACGLDTVEDASNALMKLVSVAGLAMCAIVGQDDAVARLEGTARHIAKPEYSGPWKIERAH